MAIRHVIKPGEGVDSVAFAYGFFPETVWDHPENATLKRARASRNVLAEGDVLFIPDRELKTVSLPTGKVHTFQRRGVPAKVRVQLMDGQQPIAGVAYRLVVPGHGERTGLADDQGVVEAWVPPDVTRATLFFGDEESSVPLELGRLDPIDLPRGQQQRLNNLGFSCDRADGVIDDRTRSAVMRFQCAMRIDPTGELDAATVEALGHVHDRDGAFPSPDGGA